MEKVFIKALIALLPVLVTGCDLGFDDQSLVSDLRILGLKTDPPEYLGPDYADKDRNVTVSILLANPLGAGEGGKLSCLLRTCVIPGDYRCDDESSTVMLAEGPCVDGVTSFDVTIPVGIIQQTRAADPSWRAIEAGIQKAIDEGVNPALAETMGRSTYSGTAVWVEIVIRGGPLELRGLQSVILSPANPVGRVANSNPVIVGVRLQGQTAGTVPEIPFTPGRSVRVEVLKTWNSKETYILPTFDPPFGSTPVEEFLTFAFYSNAGDFSPNTTTEKPGSVFNAEAEDEEPTELWSSWTAPSSDEMPKGGVRFWFVLIDGRGGTDWLTMNGVELTQ